MAKSAESAGTTESGPEGLLLCSSPEVWPILGRAEAHIQS